MALKKAETTEIIPAETNMINVDAAVEQWKAYQRVTQEILDENDYLKIGDGRFKKKSAWRKYKRAFNVSTEIIEKNITKLKNNRTQEAEFIVRATLPDGTFSDGYGACSIDEYNGKKPNHDIPATAQTRATNRAISDLIGAGEVTAEEAQNGIIKENEAIEVEAEDIEVIK